MSQLGVVVLFLVVSVLGDMTTSYAANVTLQWDASTDPTVTGYKVYYRTDSPAQPFLGTGTDQGDSPIDVKNTTTTSLSGLDPSPSYYFAVTAYDAAGQESVYSNIVTKFDTIAPTVSISSPASSAMVAGTVSVTANAFDDVGVDRVEYYVNGVLQFTDTSTPYLYSWSTAYLAAGSYTLTAKAYDDRNNVGISGSVTVNVVKDTAAPAITITSPANNATVSGTVTITASASDNVGLSSLAIYQSGTPLIVGNVSPLSFSWNTTSVANGAYTLVAQASDAAGNISTSSSVAVTVSNTTTSSQSVNVARASNGGVATASSSYSSSYPVFSVINGDRKGINWNAGGGWNDVTLNSFPDWVQITFSGQKAISEIDVFTLQDAPATPVEPTTTQTFTKYGITAFDVEYWNGSSWLTVPGGNITGNSLVWRKISFAAITTNQIRVRVNASPDGYSRITEIEAYTTSGTGGDITAPAVSLTTPASGSTVSGTVAVTASASDSAGVSRVEFYLNSILQASDTSYPYTYTWDTISVANGSYTLVARAYDTSNNASTSSNVAVTVNNTTSSQSVNVARASNGGVATASSSYSSSYPVSSVINGDRKGINWNAGGGWNDVTLNGFPDWVQITFSGQKAISEIDVFTLQDAPATPVEPTATQTFTKYGITAFDVEYWNGSSWLTVPGGNITGNSLVWRKISFAAIITNQIRVRVNASPDGYSRITEIEAY